MKAIVHIGTPKTGSTSIQTFLHTNTEALARRGIRYHRNHPERDSHFEYPLALLSRMGRLLPSEFARLRFRARTLEEQASNYDHYASALAEWPRRFSESVAVFSSEEISSWLRTPELVAGIDQLFGSVFDQVRYVLYLRHPAEKILSDYSELLKQGHTPTLQPLIESRLRELDYSALVERWTDVVGRARLDVRLLDRQTLTGGDLISDFCAAMEIDPSGLPVPPRQNEALSAPGAEALRQLNLRIPVFMPDGRHNPHRERLRELIQGLSEHLAPLGLTKAQRALIDTHCQPALERLRVSHFPHPAEVFPAGHATELAMDDTELQTQALEVMAEVVARLAREPLCLPEASSAVVSSDRPAAQGGLVTGFLGALRARRAKG